MNRRGEFYSQQFTPSQVYQWLEKVFTGEQPLSEGVCETFERENINGDVFLLLNEEHLRNKLNLKLGDAVRLVKVINELNKDPGFGEPKPKRVKSAALDDFWDQLQSAVINKHRILHLPGNIPFLGQHDLPDKIYVRQSYEDLHQLIHDHYKECDILITGNPGTGKSFFMLYELYRLRQSGQPIVCHVASRNKLFVADEEGFRLEDESDLNRASLVTTLLNSKETFYLFDAASSSTQRPQVCAAKTIVFSSPAKVNYHQFFKDAKEVHSLFMPIWLEVELQVCREHVHPKRSEQVVSQLFEKWGGIPRYVLSKSEQDVRQLDDEIGRCSTESLISEARNSSYGIGENSHKLLHLCVVVGEQGNLDYEKAEIHFASDYVLRRIIERQALREYSDAVAFVYRSQNIGQLATARGEMFEALAHIKLKKGGTFQVRCLEQPNSPVTNFEVREVAETRDIRIIDDILHYKKYCQNSYLQPTVRNFPCVDALLTPNIGFQMTVSDTHPLKLQLLRDIVENLGCKRLNFDLYFVVPDDMFENFPKQNYLTTTGSKAIRQPQNIRQYVLKLDFPRPER